MNALRSTFKRLRPETSRTLFAFTLRLLGIGSGIVTAAVLSRSLGVSNFGTLALGLTILGALGQLADSGMISAVSAEVSRAPSRAGELACSAVVARFSLALVCTAAVILTSHLWLDGPAVHVVLILSACAPLGAIGAMVGVSNSQIRPHVAAALGLSQGLLWLIVSIVVAATAPTPTNFAIGYLCLSTFQATLTAGYFLRLGLIARPTAASIMLISKRALPAAVLGLLVTIYYRVDSILLYTVLGSDATGLYAAAYRFLDVAQILPSLLIVPLLPILTGAVTDPVRRKLLAGSLVRIALSLGIFGCLALGFGAPVAIGLVYGPDYVEAILPMRILAIAYVGIVMGYVGTTAVFALRRTWRQIVGVSVIAALSVGLQYLAISRLGVEGAAIVTVLTEFAVATNSLAILKKSMGEDFVRIRLVTALLLCIVALAAQTFLANYFLQALVASALIGLLFMTRIVRVVDLQLALKRRVDE